MSQAKRRQKDMRGSTFNGFLLVGLGMVVGSVVTAMYLGYQSTGGSNTIGSGLRDFLESKTPKALAEPTAESAPTAAAPPLKIEFHERLAENEVVMAKAETPAVDVVDVTVVAPTSTTTGAVRATTTQTATTTPSKPPAASVTAVTPTSNNKPGRLALLQVGSFRAHADAERLKAQLAMKGLAANIEPGDIDGRKTWRVRLGPYGTNNGRLESVRSELSGHGFQPLEIGIRQ